jgi:methylglutaconyl-CoA hydratase
VTRQIGDKNARDLFLTGRIIDAAEALRLGMITKIVPAEQLMDETQALAESLLAGSPTSLLVTKRLLCRLAAPEIDRDLELAIEESAQIRSTPDFREGLASFLEKRRPRWSPR